MRKVGLFGLAVLGCAALAAPAAAADTNFELRAGDITGEGGKLDKKSGQQWVPIISWEWRRYVAADGSFKTDAKLEKQGWLQRTPSANDRRVTELRMTDAGTTVIDETVEDVGRRANFARHYDRLSDEDKNHLVRIMGELHNQLDRDFISASR